MTIARRHFVGLGAASLGAVALDGCGGLFKTASAPRSDEIDRLLAQLDHVVAGLKSLEPDVKRFGIDPSTPKSDVGRAAAKRLLTTICCLGSYRDVPQAVWEEPRVAAHLGKTLPDINEAINKARAHLANLDAGEAARIDKKLKDDPNLTMRIMERVDEYANQIDVPFEQRTYLRTATAQIAGRFRYEGTKEVTSKLASQYQRMLTSRVNTLGMQGEVETGGEEEPKKTTPEPLRVQFRTRAQPKDVRAATCNLEPKVTLDGAERPIQLDWEEFHCPTTRTIDEQAIRGAVHMETAADGNSLVTVVIYPPAGASTDTISNVTTAIGQELRRRLAAGQACTTSEECGPLKCISGTCRDPYNKPSTMASTPHAQSRLGSVGESCRTKSDCQEELLCSHNTCRTEDEVPHSAKLMDTTAKVAKWGAILLIPPICAVGVLVLLVCLFMVIVAGCMYAGGD
jgi:hypothetical protein